MKIVYIAHPLSDNPNANRANAVKWIGWAVIKGVAPIADWISISQCFDESPTNRQRGLEIDFLHISKCDEIWLVGGVISPGMKLEYNEAYRLGIPAIDFTSLGYKGWRLCGDRLGGRICTKDLMHTQHEKHSDGSIYW